MDDYNADMGKAKSPSRKADQVLAGERLKAAREKKGLSQGQVGTKVGVGQPAVDKWESGATEPGATVLGKLARIYGVTPKSLLRPPDQERFFCIKHERYHEPGYRTFDECERLHRRP